MVHALNASCARTAMLELAPKCQVAHLVALSHGIIAAASSMQVGDQSLVTLHSSHS